jgi:hypothetical protein
LLLVLAAGPSAVDVPSAASRAFDAATDAWDRGDYITALTEYLRLLNGPDGPAFFDRIALQTGELYQSSELTADGRNPVFSPDGRFVSFETGLEVSRRTRVVRNDGTQMLVADLPGVSATFSPAGPTVAYFKIADTPDLQAAVQAVEAAALTAPNRGRLVQMLSWQMLRARRCDLRSEYQNQTIYPRRFCSWACVCSGRRTLYSCCPEAENPERSLRHPPRQR